MCQQWRQLCCCFTHLQWLYDHRAYTYMVWLPAWDFLLVFYRNQLTIALTCTIAELGAWDRQTQRSQHWLWRLQYVKSYNNKWNMAHKKFHDPVKESLHITLRRYNELHPLISVLHQLFNIKHCSFWSRQLTGGRWTWKDLRRDVWTFLAAVAQNGVLSQSVDLTPDGADISVSEWELKKAIAVYIADLRSRRRERTSIQMSTITASS